jgi:hypothetical protein
MICRTTHTQFLISSPSWRGGWVKVSMECDVLMITSNDKARWIRGRRLRGLLFGFAKLRGFVKLWGLYRLLSNKSQWKNRSEAKQRHYRNGSAQLVGTAFMFDAIPLDWHAPDFAPPGRCRCVIPCPQTLVPLLLLCTRVRADDGSSFITSSILLY